MVHLAQTLFLSFLKKGQGNWGSSAWGWYNHDKRGWFSWTVELKPRYNIFDLPSEDEVIRDFEKETHTFIDAEKQVKHEKHLENEYKLDR